jgi:hypothetical protein
MLSKQSHISVRKRDGFRLATEIIAVRITMSTLSMTCMSEFPVGITEPALFLRKFVVRPVHYHRVSGARFSQCVLFLKMLRPSVRLNLYNNSNHMNSVARNLMFLKITRSCQYITVLFTVTQIQWILYRKRIYFFWAYFQANRQNTRIRKYKLFHSSTQYSTRKTK